MSVISIQGTVLNRQSGLSSHHRRRTFVCNWGTGAYENHSRITLKHNGHYEFRLVLGCNDSSAPINHMDDFTVMGEAELFQSSVVWEFNTVPFEFYVQIQKIAKDYIQNMIHVCVDVTDSVQLEVQY